MSLATDFGPIISSNAVERALIAHIKAWLPDYLARAAEGEEFPAPTSKVRYSVVAQMPPANAVLPQCVVISPGGVPSAPDQEGWVSKTFAISVAVWSGADEYDTTQQKAKLYGAAIEAMLAEQPAIADDMRVIDALGDIFTRTDQNRARSLYCAESAWNVKVDRVRNVFAGPTEPTPEGEDPTPFPTLLTSELHVEAA